MLNTWADVLNRAGLGMEVMHERNAHNFPLDLAAAGVVLGDTYPHPIVDHAFARHRVLAVYQAALGKS